LAPSRDRSHAEPSRAGPARAEPSDLIYESVARQSSVSRQVSDGSVMVHSWWW